jgi:hypothetical protein
VVVVGGVFKVLIPLVKDPLEDESRGQTRNVMKKWWMVGADTTAATSIVTALVEKIGPSNIVLCSRFFHSTACISVKGLS